jgi:hypothetical protein
VTDESVTRVETGEYLDDPRFRGFVRVTDGTEDAVLRFEFTHEGKCLVYSNEAGRELLPWLKVSRDG